MRGEGEGMPSGIFKLVKREIDLAFPPGPERITNAPVPVKPPLPAWISPTADGALLRLKVVPNAPRTRVDGPHGDALKIRLQAPPVDGKANDALVRFLAETLACPRAAIRVSAGATGRWKSIQIAGLSPASVVALLHPDAPGG